MQSGSGPKWSVLEQVGQLPRVVDGVSNTGRPRVPQRKADVHHTQRSRANPDGEHTFPETPVSPCGGEARPVLGWDDHDPSYARCQPRQAGAWATRVHRAAWSGAARFRRLVRRAPAASSRCRVQLACAVRTPLRRRRHPARPSGVPHHAELWASCTSSHYPIFQRQRSQCSSAFEADVLLSERASIRTMSGRPLSPSRLRMRSTFSSSPSEKKTMTLIELAVSLAFS